MILLLACAKTVAPVGPNGLACEGKTAVLVEPEPWAELTVLTINGLPGPQIVLPDATAREPLVIQVDEQACTVPPTSTGGETGICDGIGLAVHYTPLCELAPRRTVVATTRTFIVDTSKRCLPDTHSIGDAEREGHQTCGGRPPGDSAEGLPAVPFGATFPYLQP